MKQIRKTKGKFLWGILTLCMIVGMLFAMTTAVYAANIYSLTVENGSITGEMDFDDDTVAATLVSAGTVVEVKAIAPTDSEVDQKFQGWTSDNDTIIFTDPTSETTKFIMPAGALKVTAEFAYDVIIEPVYMVTVVDGLVNNGGTYEEYGYSTAGGTITIKANDPATDYSFCQWAANSTFVVLDNATSAETTFNMPSHDVVIAATYAQTGLITFPTSYSITVENGQVSGASEGAMYATAAGTVVTVEAVTPTDDSGVAQKFKEWTSDNDTVIFTDPTSATTTFVMPTSAITVTAVFEDDVIIEPVYMVTAVGGSVNNGETYEEYGYSTAGGTITIKANEAYADAFEKWMANSTFVVFTDATSTETTFTMPSHNVVVTALYSLDTNNLSSVTQEDISYGGTLDPQVAYTGFGQNGGDVTFTYIGSGTTEYTESTTQPTYVGDYTVTATSAATDATLGAAVSAEFSITALEQTPEFLDFIMVDAGATYDLSTLVPYAVGEVTYTLTNGVGSLAGAIYTAPESVSDAPKIQIEIAAVDANEDGVNEYNAYSGTVTLSVSSSIVVLYTVTYDANGGSGTMLSPSMQSGTEYTLSENGFIAPDGIQFKEWQIDGVSYSAGATYIITSNVTVKAIWETIVVDEEDDTTETTGNEITGITLGGAAVTIGTDTNMIYMNSGSEEDEPIGEVFTDNSGLMLNQSYLETLASGSTYLIEFVNGSGVIKQAEIDVPESGTLMLWAYNSLFPTTFLD